MAVDIVIPSAGESVTSGVISRWLKNDGDFVKRDEDVLEVETDKVTLAVPAPAAGVLKTGVKPGDTVNIGQVVGAVDDKAAAPGGAAAPKPAALAATPAPQAEGSSNGHAAAAGVDADVRATPLAKKLASEHGVDLANVHGSGAGGRIREQDVQQLIEAKDSGPAVATVAKPAPSSPAPQPVAGSNASRRERMSPLRQRIAQRLVEAQHTAAMLTTFNEVDMSAVMSLRSAHKEAFEKKNGVGLGFMSFFVKAVVQALKGFPTVNASIVTDRSGQMEVEHHDFYDVAVAVGTPKGLTVPVLRGCDRLSFAQIESGIKELAGKARDGKLTLAELQGGTFTITNGGIYGSLMSTPILNPPQSGILGMHSIKNRAVEYPVGSGQVGVRPMMYLALSYDHRLVDGAEAVQFLVSIKNSLESPERLLLGL